MGVRFMRKEKGMSMMVLAEKSGVMQPTISRIERGLQMPRADTAVALARALGCTVEDLLAPDPAEEERPGA